MPHIRKSKLHLAYNDPYCPTTEQENRLNNVKSSFLFGRISGLVLSQPKIRKTQLIKMVSFVILLNYTCCEHTIFITNIPVAKWFRKQYLI